MQEWLPILLQFPITALVLGALFIGYKEFRKQVTAERTHLQTITDKFTTSIETVTDNCGTQMQLLIDSTNEDKTRLAQENRMQREDFTAALERMHTKHSETVERALNALGDKL